MPRFEMSCHIPCFVELWIKCRALCILSWSLSLNLEFRKINNTNKSSLENTNEKEKNPSGDQEYNLGQDADVKNSKSMYFKIFEWEE